MRNLLLILSLLMAPLFAQPITVTVDKSQLKDLDTATTVEKVGAWVGLGKEVGLAVKEGLGALTEETEKFSKTSPGKLTMFIILYKTIGTDLVQLIVGVCFALVWIPVLLWLIRVHCMPYNEVSKKTDKEGNVTVVDKSVFLHGDYSAEWAFCLGIATVLLIIINVLIMFV